MTNDAIESPSHYSFGMMEAREIIELAIADFRDPATVYHVASALKYLLRASRKNGADDIAKARKHIGWAEDAARAYEKRVLHSKLDLGARLGDGYAASIAHRHGDINQVCGLDRDPHEILEEIAGVRDAGELTQPPNCSPGVSEPTPPMHAAALEMAEAAIPKRRGESAWSVTWAAEPQTAYQTPVGN